jgi:hypothetical protein
MLRARRDRILRVLHRGGVRSLAARRVLRRLVQRDDK